MSVCWKRTRAFDAQKKRSVVDTLNIALSIAQSFKTTHPVFPRVGTR